jgi:hypothetical protein
MRGSNVIHFMSDGGWIAMATFVAIVLVLCWPRISTWIENRWFRR